MIRTAGREELPARQEIDSWGGRVGSRRERREPEQRMCRTEGGSEYCRLLGSISSASWRPAGYARTRDPSTERRVETVRGPSDNWDGGFEGKLGEQRYIHNDPGLWMWGGRGEEGRGEHEDKMDQVTQSTTEEKEKRKEKEERRERAASNSDGDGWMDGWMNGMGWDGMGPNPGKAADPGLVCAGRARCRDEQPEKNRGSLVASRLVSVSVIQYVPSKLSNWTKLTTKDSVSSAVVMLFASAPVSGSPSGWAVDENSYGIPHGILGTYRSFSRSTGRHRGRGFSV